jgi:hypothetical protein
VAVTTARSVEVPSYQVWLIIIGTISSGTVPVLPGIFPCISGTHIPIMTRTIPAIADSMPSSTIPFMILFTAF